MLVSDGPGDGDAWLGSRSPTASPLACRRYCRPGFYKSAEYCMKCPEKSPVLLVLMILLLITFLIAFARYANKFKGLGSPRILMNYVAVTSAFMYFNIAWPDILKDFFRFLQMFAINIDVVHPECEVEVSFYVSWMLTMMMPLGIIWIMLQFYVIECIYRWSKLRLVGQECGKPLCSKTARTVLFPCMHLVCEGCARRALAENVCPLHPLCTCRPAPHAPSDAGTREVASASSKPPFFTAPGGWESASAAEKSHRILTFLSEDLLPKGLQVLSDFLCAGWAALWGVMDESPLQHLRTRNNEANDDPTTPSSKDGRVPAFDALVRASRTRHRLLEQLRAQHAHIHKIHAAQHAIVHEVMRPLVFAKLFDWRREQLLEGETRERLEGQRL